MGCAGCGKRRRTVITSEMAQEMVDSQNDRDKYEVVAPDGSTKRFKLYADARREQKANGGRLVNLL